MIAPKIYPESTPWSRSGDYGFVIQHPWGYRNLRPIIRTSGESSRSLDLASSARLNCPPHASETRRCKLCPCSFVVAAGVAVAVAVAVAVSAAAAAAVAAVVVVGGAAAAAVALTLAVAVAVAVAEAVAVRIVNARAVILLLTAEVWLLVALVCSSIQSHSTRID